MATFKAGRLDYALKGATLHELASVFEDLSTLSCQAGGPDDEPSRVSYDGETLTVEYEEVA